MNYKMLLYFTILNLELGDIIRTSLTEIVLYMISTSLKHYMTHYWGQVTPLVTWGNLDDLGAFLDSFH